MKTQSETVAELVLKMKEGPISQADLLRFGNACYQAGLARGALLGQNHFASVFDKVFRGNTGV